jgi:rhodanese-related sulfurtransferase
VPDRANARARHDDRDARVGEGRRAVIAAAEAPAIPLVDREALEAKLASGAPFKLIMASSEFGFRAKHIPGSLHAKVRGETFAGLSKDDDIVVYCSNIDCIASKAVIQQLLERGFRNVSHYAGGLIDWEAAGLPVAGDWAG